MVGADRVYGLSDGEQLAILEWQGDQPGEPSSIPDGGCGRSADRAAVALLRADADYSRAGISGVGRGGAAGIFVEQGTTAPLSGSILENVRQGFREIVGEKD